ncbi:MAG TPA: hypothetical protein VLY85_02850 [Thermoplasmata archaeon]|nr:hypothetical protein [Thermoplasmata archaeon]
MTGLREILATATLERTRRLIARPGGRGMAIFLGTVYALGSMLIGQMLILARNAGSHFAVILWSGNGAQSWNYPALLVSASWGVLTLPFFATLAMLVVSAGVWIGMSASVLLVIRVVRERRLAPGGPASLSALTGLTPALFALLTLGACCSTTAATTAGIALIAQSSGTQVGSLLYNNWYLGVFQIAVLWVALMAQEELLGVYGRLRGASDLDPAHAPMAAARTPYLGAALRAVLLVAGLTWALWLLAEWTALPPPVPSAWTWVGWIGEHVLLAGLAISVGLFPGALWRAIERGARSLLERPLRGVVLAFGAVQLVGTPPPISGWGWYGLVNEVLGAAGVPGTLGGVEPTFAPGVALYLSWALQFGLVGAFAVAAAVAPRRTIGFVLPRGRFAPDPSAAPPARTSSSDRGDAIGRSSSTPRIPEGARSTASGEP